MNIKHLLPATLVLAGVCALAASKETDSTQSARLTAKAAKPRMEVCFVLDTTGSMGGLIEGAKQKIWAIANEMISAKPTPELRLGMVAYRDRGDEYVTKTFDLTNDIDAIYGHLQSFKAAGGGDEPESVNEALQDAVRKLTWSQDRKVLKIIFLVGDAPPHMDYAGGPKYPQVSHEEGLDHQYRPVRQHCRDGAILEGDRAVVRRQLRRHRAVRQHGGHPDAHGWGTGRAQSQARRDAGPLWRRERTQSCCQQATCGRGCASRRHCRSPLVQRALRSRRAGRGRAAGRPQQRQGEAGVGREGQAPSRLAETG